MMILLRSCGGLHHCVTRLLTMILWRNCGQDLCVQESRPARKRPFKKHKFREPQHTKTTAFAYQVAWNFQSSSQRSILASTTPDVALPGTPGGPPIHRPLFKGLYLDALGMAVSLATPTFSEPVNPHPYSLGFLPLSKKTGSAKESLLLANPVLPKGARQRLFVGLDTGGLYHRFLQRERLLHPELDTSSSNIVQLYSRYHGEPYFMYSSWWLQCALTFKACLSEQMVLQLQ
jgi:hypothetical protein